MPKPLPPVTNRLNAALGRALDQAEQLLAEGKKDEGLRLIDRVLDIIETANGTVRDRMKARLRP